MARSMRVFTPLVFLLLASIVAESTQADVSCFTVVVENLGPCLDYAAQGGVDLLDNCCNGIRDLKEEAKSPSDRKAVCGCIKDAFDVKPLPPPGFVSNFTALPSKCNITYNIDPSADCNSIQ